MQFRVSQCKLSIYKISKLKMQKCWFTFDDKCYAFYFPSWIKSCEMGILRTFFDILHQSKSQQWKVFFELPFSYSHSLLIVRKNSHQEFGISTSYDIIIIQIILSQPSKWNVKFKFRQINGFSTRHRNCSMTMVFL